ncbi:MAG TPA: hypothetical protein VNW71_04875 [Thermoanaerobaculia bacterium]|nr:hypothetical protein [Thermoanaerobaculia bacterium]
MSAILLAVLLALAGRALPVSRWTVRLMAGAVMFHLLLTAYDLLGVRWGRVAVVLPLVVLAGLGRRTARAPRTARTIGAWGEGAALFALTTFAAFAPTLWIATPDFVFHWGLKGERFFLARGVDYSWLAKGWNWVIHPDYPNLLPELFAGTAILEGWEGRFEASSQMLWSVLFFALILVSGREALRQTGTPRPFAPAGLAIAAFALAGFGIVHRMAGAADWMPALALAAALPALLRPADRQGDWEVGIAAAFAAASKIEGMPLAAFLAGVQFLRRREMGAALRLGLPMAVVAGTWAIQTFRHGLYQQFNSGTFDLGRAPEVLRGLAEVAGWKESWHGLTLVLLATPLLLLPRRTRAAGAVISLQLLFYLWTYLSSAVDTEYQVVASFPRLAMHLFPAVVMAGAVALGEREAPLPR